MQTLIDDTLAIARSHFLGFGFEEQQITPLLEAGSRDLTKELRKLQALLSQEPVPFEQINLSMHALKGLLLNMGNVEAADKFNELRSQDDEEQVLSGVRELLGASVL